MPPKSASRPAAAPALSAPPEPAPAWLFPIVAALALLALFSMFTAPVADNDTWFHLRTGAYIVQNHKLPDPDPFSWTTYIGQPTYSSEAATRDLNIKHEWGAQVLLYLVYAAGGFPGMVLFRACCLTFFSGMVGWVIWLRTGRFYLSVAATMAAGMIARSAAADRPYLVTYALMALTLWILERRRPLWLLPPLFVVWANAHGGYFMGWVLLGGYCGEALFQRLRGQPPKDEKTLWGASLLAILASGLNPTYFNVIPGLFAYQHSALQRSLKEWHAPALWPPSWYSCLLVGAAAVLLWAWRRVQALGHPAVRSIRHPFPDGAAQRDFHRIDRAHRDRKLPPRVEASAAAHRGVRRAPRPAGHRRPKDRRRGSLSIPPDSWQYPAGPVKFLKEHNVTGPMFNIYEWGGYLMWDAWPLQKTFVDGRALNESVFRDYMRIAYNYRDAQTLLDQYGVQVLVLQGFEYWRGTVYMLSAALTDPNQTKWKLVYQDKTAMIFMRQPPPGVTPLNLDRSLHQPGGPVL